MPNENAEFLAGAIQPDGFGPDVPIYGAGNRSATEEAHGPTYADVLQGQ